MADKLQLMHSLAVRNAEERREKEKKREEGVEENGKKKISREDKEDREG